MGSGNFKLYLFLAVLTLFVVVPVVKSALQEASLGQDIRSIEMEYSMYGQEAFRGRLIEIVERAPLDPEEVDIQIRENRPEAKVLIEIRYVSRMRVLLFYPVERQVVVRREILLVPL